MVACVWVLCVGCVGAVCEDNMYEWFVCECCVRTWIGSVYEGVWVLYV